MNGILFFTPLSSKGIVLNSPNEWTRFIINCWLLKNISVAFIATSFTDQLERKLESRWKLILLILESGAYLTVAEKENKTTHAFKKGMHPPFTSGITLCCWYQVIQYNIGETIIPARLNLPCFENSIKKQTFNEGDLLVQGSIWYWFARMYMNKE